MDGREMTSAEEWRRYGTVVLAAFVGFSLLSVMPGSLSLFIEPLGQEFGWNRTLISFGYTCATVVTATLSPFFGVLIDRYGSRRVALPGIVLVTGVICAFALLSGSSLQWLLLWSFYGLIAVAVKTTVWTAAVAGLFRSAQGLALGLTLCGAAVAHAALPPLTNALIAGYGWRTTFIILGLGWGGMTLLVCWLFLYDAHSHRMLGTSKTEEAEAKPIFSGLSLAEAWRSMALWRIGIATVVTMSLSIGFGIHQIAILGEAGISRGTAAWLAGLAGIAAIAGKLVTGVLLDRFRPNWIGGLTFAAMAFSFGLLIDGVHTPGLIIFAMLMNGYTQGTNLQICSYLTALYGGMRNYGVIFGFMTSLIAIGSGFGPVMAGFAYDMSGGYAPFLIAGTLGSILSGLMMMTLPRYVAFEAKPESEVSTA